MTYPTLKTSASLRNEELIKIGNGYFSNNLGKRTMAAHCSPTLGDLKPKKIIMMKHRKHFFGKYKLPCKLHVKCIVVSLYVACILSKQLISKCKELIN